MRLAIFKFCKAQMLHFTVSERNGHSKTQKDDA